MEYKYLEMIEKKACEELKTYAEKGFKTAGDVTIAKELMSICHKACDLMEREEGQSMAMSRGYSGAGHWRADGVFGDRYAYADGESYRGMGDMSTSRGMSGRRGRDAMGRYTSYDGDMVERLNEMLQETQDPKKREALERCLREFR